ncbi:MAG: helix-turn-helix transcriptional regulator [Clostridia bacterium]|nr:helix-turn-helix transcriptional regulator [Clostridia bacterium]
MFELNSIYTPITALPGVRNDAYSEIIPCIALRPYIRCFWGTSGQIKNCEIPGRPVIPDTCMDMIFRVNDTKNTNTGRFCVIDERPYPSHVIHNSDMVSIFGIRFYAWSAVLFADGSLNHNEEDLNIDNLFYGFKTEFESILWDCHTLEERIAAAEKILLRRFNWNKQNPHVMNGLFFMITNHGNVKIADISSYTGISQRSLERMFRETMGVSPKTIQSLIRYQLLWQDIYLHRQFDVFDAVLKYGYSDQAHLLNDFKRKHAMTPREALHFSLS